MTLHSRREPYRIELSLTRSESVAIAIEGPIDDPSQSAPSGPVRSPRSTDRRPLWSEPVLPVESSPKLPERRRR